MHFNSFGALLFCSFKLDSLDIKVFDVKKMSVGPCVLNMVCLNQIKAKRGRKSWGKVTSIGAVRRTC